jgi:hypothetical protein
VVEELFRRGAKLPSNAGTLLAQAVGKGNPVLVRTLIGHGVDVKASRLALRTAIRVGSKECIDLLIDSAGQDDLNVSLAEAAQNGDIQLVNALLARGADVNATAGATSAGKRFSVLMAAALSEYSPVEAVKILVAKGAAIEAKSPDGNSALDFAAQQGMTTVAAFLRAAGAPERPQSQRAGTPSAAGSVRAAILRSLPLLQRSDVTFAQKSGCVSCHNNSLTAMTVAAARGRGLPVNDEIARRRLKATGAYLDGWRERALQGDAIPGLWNTVGYVLVGLGAEGYPPDSTTDALARYLKDTQLPDGRWWNFDGRLRSPIDSSDIQVTAMAVRALTHYAPKPYLAETRAAILRAANWLKQARARTTEDRAFQLLGLAWSGARGTAMKTSASELLSQQRPDGGWAQLSSLESDAYATGQVLVALREYGAIRPSDPAYRRAIAYLLNTQLDDGSWYVRSRAIPAMPYFESDFPHGQDQFISAAATNWAVLALIPVSRR